MPRRLPRPSVVIRGVKYVPEDPAVATRREVERTERVYAKRLSIATADSVRRGGPQKPRAQQDASLHHHVMTLSGGANSFTFEGSIVLPPLSVATAPGKGSMIVFMVGRVPAYGHGYRKPHKTLIYANAYGQLADDILARYHWKDHVVVNGVITSMTRYSRPIVTLAVQRIELLTRHVDNAAIDDTNASFVAAMTLPDGADAENVIIDAMLSAKQSAKEVRQAAKAAGVDDASL